MILILAKSFFCIIINICDVNKYPCPFNATRPSKKEGQKRPEGGAEQL